MSGVKRQGLLALLALRGGRVVGVDSLVDALWGDDLPAAPRNAVQHHVARLRAALGQETIAVSPDGYALAGAAVDALWGQLMLALYRCGRQPDALEAYGEARRVLSEQMALEPGPELRRLQEAILTHDPAIASTPVKPRRRGNLTTPSTSFVGREQELAQVVELLREYASSR